MIEKTSRIIILFDFYQSLLTDKQKAYIRSYYEDDLSLSEVAEKFGVSRNAVYDNVKRVESLLEEYENKLMLHSKYLKKLEIIDEIKKYNYGEIENLLKHLAILVIDYKWRCAE